MTFSPNPDAGGWSAHAEFRGKGIEVDIDADMWESDLEEAAKAALDRLQQRWPEIENALLLKPLKLYNEAWADPAQGFPTLAASQFLQKLSLTTVCIGQGSLTLYFDDGNLFGGHTVSVSILGNRDLITMVEG